MLVFGRNKGKAYDETQPFVSTEVADKFKLSTESNTIIEESHLWCIHWSGGLPTFRSAQRNIPCELVVLCLQKRPATLLLAIWLKLVILICLFFSRFIAVRNPYAEKKWKLVMRGDLGIYLGAIWREVFILCHSTGAIHVRLDCVKLELTEQTLQSYYDSRLRLSDAGPPNVRIYDAKIVFELTSWQWMIPWPWHWHR